MQADLAALSDATAAAALLAVDPLGFGGVKVRAGAGPARDRWLAGLRGMLPSGTPWRRLPLGIGDDRLLGGLDLAATLAAGRPMSDRGLLAEADGGLVLIGMAERIPGPLAARLAAVMDTGTVAGGRGGSPQPAQARLGLVALDEGIEDEAVPAALAERLAFWVDIEAFDPARSWPDAAEVADAARLFPSVRLADSDLAAMAEVAAALGIGSLRAPIMAARAARAAAALAGRSVVGADDTKLAARLVLAPRATRWPVAPETESQSQQEAGAEAPADAGSDDAAPQNSTSQEPAEVILAAAKAALPPDLLARLQGGQPQRLSRPTPGRGGDNQIVAKRGRPIGVQRGHLGGGARLNVIETLRAAAPWQKLRARPDGRSAGRVEIRRDDLRVTRYRQRAESTTIFVVDASGSLAANRLAEAKGAVELLLADCYIRRDQVALLAFRGQGAELLLPPTRSLARAKRCLAELPGGGATPLATAIDAAAMLADRIRRRGPSPVLVFITDGRANVARDGTTGRAGAEADVHQAARAAGAAGLKILVVDAAPRPQETARTLARDMNATYLPLPRAEAASLSAAVRAVGN